MDLNKPVYHVEPRNMNTAPSGAIRWEQFYRDDVLDSFNMSYRDKDSILDQKHEKHISLTLYFEDFLFLKLLLKMHIERNAAHNIKELMKLNFSDVFYGIRISIKNIRIYLLFVYLNKSSHYMLLR